MEALKIDREAVADKGVTILHVHGPLNPTTVPRFMEVLQEIFDKDMFRIVLDLVDVDYISSAGISALISALTTAQENHGDVILIHSKPKVLEMMGLIDTFHFAADPAAATALF